MLRQVGPDESGNVLITVVLVSMIIGALAAAALRTGEHAQTSSASDRNHQAALAVAESGIHDAIAKINDDPFAYMECPGIGDCTLTATTPEGDYDLLVSHCGTGPPPSCAAIDDSFILESDAGSGGDVLGRNRSVRVTLAPPPLFDEEYALFSFTSIDLKNNDGITGDVWANDSVLIRSGTAISGSVTAATSWIKLENGASIGDFAWSGGYNSFGGSSKAITMAGNSSVGGWAKASVSSPSDPDTCSGETASNYDIEMLNGSEITGEVTTLGTILPDEGTHGTLTSGECTSAPPIKSLPEFHENVIEFDETFSSVAEFESQWLSGNLNALQGAIRVHEPSPSQTDRIDLTGAVLAGDFTLVTEAPVYANNMSDDESVIGPDGAVMVIVSHYEPPPSTACDVNNDTSECAIHIKNNLDYYDPGCTTAVLLYADNGPVAVKNNANSGTQGGMCGSVIAEGILMKNNQTVEYDDRIARILGFGAVTYEIARWEECPVSGCAP